MANEISRAIAKLPFLLGNLIDWPASIYPDKPAIETVAGIVTYGQLLQTVLNLTPPLSEFASASRKHWAVVVEDPMCFLPLCLALFRAGCVVAPLRKQPPDEQLEQFLRANGFAGIIVARRFIASRRPVALSQLTCLDIGEDYVAFPLPTDEVAALSESRDPPLLIDLDPALMLWSSGSTRSCRGALFAHHAVLANVWANIKAMGFRDDDRSLIVLPLAHAYGLIHQCFCHLAIGATLCVPDGPLPPPILLRSLEHFRVTNMAIVPPILEVLVAGLKNRRVPSSLRLLTIGAARARAESIELLRKAMPELKIVITYGLTEAGPRVASRFLENGSLPADPECVGAPLPNTQIHLRQALGGRQELCVRSRSVMDKYIDNPTAEPRDTMLPTGDYAELRDGQLHIRGRLKRSVNRGGLIIPVEPIEQVLESFPGVRLAVVQSAAHPFWGEVPVANVYLDRPEHAIEVSDLQEYCALHLREQERPFRITILEEPAAETHSSRKEYLAAHVVR